MLTVQSQSQLRQVPSVFAGMDRNDAMAFVSRMFDAAAAGADVWDDAELVRRFLAACSRTGSAETRAGYQREIRHLVEWRDQHHGEVPLRLLDPAVAQDFVDGLLQQVAAEKLKPRTFNRRIAAISDVSFAPGRIPPFPGFAPWLSLISNMRTCSWLATCINLSSDRLPSSLRTPNCAVPI